MTSIDKNLPLANRRFSFTSNKFADNAFAVVNMTGVEMLSTTFRFEVILACDADDIDFKIILASLVTLTIFSPGATQGAAYKGMLQQFDQLQKAGGVVFYRAVLVPRVARLARYRTSDVYLDSQTVPQILVALLKSSGFSALDYEVKTRGIYRTRDLVCQYQETNLDFVNRWTEKEGLYYYFDHSGEAEKMVFVDDKTLLPPSVLSVNYRPVDTQSSTSSYDAVQNFVCRQRPLPKQVILQDFNYMLAKVPLVQASTVDLLGEGDVMLYGENFLTPDEGKRYADIRAQELACSGTVFVGDATAVGLRSGYFMHIAGHYRDSYDGDYLVTRVNHAGSQAGMLLSGIQSPYAAQGGETSYTCTFEAIPKDNQFRAERRTPRPHVGGTVSAVIDASGDGQYAEIDSLGRYKVQMPFVKPGRPAGKGSAYIRMATPYSGSGHGINFPLLKSAEVLLTFIEGDPDQPVIVNSVPNSENTSVVNTDNRTQNLIQTSGGNQILMDDLKGKEVVYITSPYNNSALVIGNPEGRTSTVGRNGKDGAAGATGASGAKGADGAKGDTGAPPPPKPYPGFWMSTAGSNESMTAGVSNAIKVGYNNAISLAVDNTLSVGVSNKFSLGTSASFSVAADVSWKMGRSVSIDDADSLSLKTVGKLQGNESVLISAGQGISLAAAVDSAKETVKTAVLLSLGVNAAAAVLAGVMLNQGAKLNDNGKVDVRQHDWGNWASRGLGLSFGPGTAIAINVMLANLAKSLEVLATQAAYASNIKLDNTGIEIKANNALLTNVGSIVAKSSGVKVSSVSAQNVLGSSINVGASGIELAASNAAGLKTQLDLDGLKAKLSAPATGEISLKQGVSSAVTLSDTKLTAKSGTAELTLEAGVSAVMGVTPGGKVSAMADALILRHGITSVQLMPAGIKVAAGPKLDISAVAVSINGTLLRLG